MTHRHNSTSRRRFLQTLAAGTAALPLGCGPGSESQPEPARPPNIIFILADDLGYGHLGCYGQTKIRTPNIDRLAAEGMRFSDAYAGATVCAPSRSTLMTGLHTGHTAVRGNGGGDALLPEDTTVAEALRQAGYRTGAFGKWGLGDIDTTGVPWRQGFDEFFGYLHQAHAHFYYPEYLWKNGEKFPLSGNHDGNREQYSHDVIFDQALGFLRNHVRLNRALRDQSSGARDNPFFLYLPLTIPHAELLVPEDSLNEYRFEETPYIDKRRHYADQPRPRAALAGMISRMDRDVGRLMNELRELNIDEETIVFFTSDNGPANGVGADPDFFQARGPLRGYKRDLYEGGIRVPMITRWPGRIPAGSESAQPCAFWDFLPTAAELAGSEPPAKIDGLSIAPTLLGAEAAGRSRQNHEYMYWEYLRGELELTRQALRMDSWKAVRPEPGAPLELYDLAADLSETRNLAEDRPELIARAEEIFAKARVEPRPHHHKGWTP